MKTQVEKFLPAAINAVELHILNKGEVPKPFKGYISSFGAAVIQTGLLPAIAFYSAQGGAEEERGKIIEALFDILKNNQIIEDRYNNLMQFLVSNPNRLHYYRTVIMDAATALKLALRTYRIADENRKNQEKNAKN